MKLFRTSLHVSPPTTTTKRLRYRQQCSTQAAVYDHHLFRMQCTDGHHWQLRAPYYKRHDTMACWWVCLTHAAGVQHGRSLEVSRHLRAKNILAFTITVFGIEDAERCFCLCHFLSLLCTRPLLILLCWSSFVSFLCVNSSLCALQSTIITSILAVFPTCLARVFDRILHIQRLQAIAHDTFTTLTNYKSKII